MYTAAQAKRDLLDIQLRDAITRNDLEAITQCLKEGADINWSSKNGPNGLDQTEWRSILGHALYSRAKIETLSFLLQHGAKLTILDLTYVIHLDMFEHFKVLMRHERRALNFRAETTGETPLHLAIKSGNKELIEFILQQNPNVHLTDAEGKTAADRALEKGNVVLAERILSLQSSEWLEVHAMVAEALNIPFFENLGSLPEVLRSVPLSLLEESIAQHLKIWGIDVLTGLIYEDGNSEDASSVEIAELEKQRKKRVSQCEIAAKLLIMRGIDINSMAISQKMPPLSVACHTGKLELASFLIKYKANVNYIDADGASVSSQLLSSGICRPEILDLLLASSDLTYQNKVPDWSINPTVYSSLTILDQLVQLARRQNEDAPSYAQCRMVLDRIQPIANQIIYDLSKVCDQWFLKAFAPFLLESALCDYAVTEPGKVCLHEVAMRTQRSTLLFNDEERRTAALAIKAANERKIAAEGAERGAVTPASSLSGPSATLGLAAPLMFAGPSASSAPLTSSGPAGTLASSSVSAAPPALSPSASSTTTSLSALHSALSPLAPAPESTESKAKI